MDQSKKRPRPGNVPDTSSSFQGWWFLFVLMIAYFGWSLYASNSGSENISYTDFKSYVKNGNVSKITVQGQTIRGEFKHPVPRNENENNSQSASSPNANKASANSQSEPGAKRFVTYLPSFNDPSLINILQANHVEIQTKPQSNSSFWLIFLMLLPFVFIIWMGFAQYRRMQGQGGGGGGLFSIGQSHARLYRKTQERTSFDDVAGARGAKTELKELVMFLKDPEKLRNLGAEVPKGYMLVGPPGTGKTLLARAVAGEADAPFFSITGSDFMEMFVGVGAKRVRSLFADAKKSAPSIIFIDEIDAIGRQRGTGLGGGHDEREQTLNQLLSELDGFEPNENVIVMTATNRPDVLDPALMRPGRFDRRIVVDLPSTSDRVAILEIYARNKQLDADVDLKQTAQGTPGFSGADLKNMLNEAALLAARQGRNNIGPDDIEEARDKIMMGLEREGLMITDEEKKMVAYHEAGHAIVGACLPLADRVHKVSIVPRSQSMGVTQQFPDHEKYIYSRRYLNHRLAVMMGGRCAEMMIFKSPTSGAGNDLQQATATARKMVLEWGMSGRFEHMAMGSPREHVFLGEQMAKPREYSEATAQEVDREVEVLLQEGYSTAETILKNNRTALDELSSHLVEVEEVPGQYVYDLLGRHAEEGKKCGDG